MRKVVRVIAGKSEVPPCEAKELFEALHAIAGGNWELALESLEAFERGGGYDLYVGSEALASLIKAEATLLASLAKAEAQLDRADESRGTLALAKRLRKVIVSSRAAVLKVAQ
jgi:hypothetical protein